MPKDQKLPQQLRQAKFTPDKKCFTNKALIALCTGFSEKM